MIEVSVNLIGRPESLDRVGFVSANGRTVRVRFDRRPERSERRRWRCDDCGAAPRPACEHAALIAQSLIDELTWELRPAHLANYDESDQA